MNVNVNVRGEKQRHFRKETLTTTFRGLRRSLTEMKYARNYWTWTCLRLSLCFCVFSLLRGCEEVVWAARPSVLEVCHHPGSCATWRTRSQSLLRHLCQSIQTVVYAFTLFFFFFQRTVQRTTTHSSFFPVETLDITMLHRNHWGKTEALFVLRRLPGYVQFTSELLRSAVGCQSFHFFSFFLSPCCAKDDHLLYLDPHYCQPTVDITKENFPLEVWGSIRFSSSFSLSVLFPLVTAVLSHAQSRSDQWLPTFYWDVPPQPSRINSRTSSSTPPAI